MCNYERKYNTKKATAKDLHISRTENTRSYILVKSLRYKTVLYISRYKQEVFLVEGLILVYMSTYSQYVWLTGTTT